MPRTITIRHQIGFHSEFPASNLNKRPASVGVLNAGVVVPISTEKEGYEYEKELSFIDADGNLKKIKFKSNLWYQDLNGWWHWDGAMTTLEEAESESDTPVIPGPGPTTPPVVTPEITFDWKKQLKKGNLVPSGWLNESGKGINIAILDAGFDLRDDCFKHLKNKVKTYDLRKPTYSNQANLESRNFVQTLDGKDNLPANKHGTACLGILAAQHPNEEIIGIAPEANYHLFNIYEHIRSPFGNGFSIKWQKKLFNKALWLISNMDIDVISVSVSYNKKVMLPAKLISQILPLKTLWFWALNTMPHPTLNEYILKPTHPSPFFDVQHVGTLASSTLSNSNNIIVPEHAKDNINFIIQRNPISVIKGKGDIHHKTPMNCSYATPVMAGLAALKLAHEKKEAGFEMKNKVFLQELEQKATRFYKDFIPGDDDFNFLRLFENPIL